mmetsp:Transcript_109264/g.223154  ORF Transcript_109264/g.223154 Transcript_109264/m.223154 type:complete len:354 (+) Transcript_109264:680-1741(+)
MERVIALLSHATAKLFFVPKDLHRHRHEGRCVDPIQGPDVDHGLLGDHPRGNPVGRTRDHAGGPQAGRLFAVEKRGQADHDDGRDDQKGDRRKADKDREDPGDVLGTPRAGNPRIVSAAKGGRRHPAAGSHRIEGLDRSEIGGGADRPETDKDVYVLFDPGVFGGLEVPVDDNEPGVSAEGDVVGWNGRVDLIEDSLGRAGYGRSEGTPDAGRSRRDRRGSIDHPRTPQQEIDREPKHDAVIDVRPPFPGPIANISTSEKGYQRSDPSGPCQNDLLGFGEKNIVRCCVRCSSRCGCCCGRCCCECCGNSGGVVKNNVVIVGKSFFQRSSQVSYDFCCPQRGAGFEKSGVDFIG